MKLGFYADYSPDTVKFAEDVGFKCMELSAWPESALNADTVSEKKLREILKDLEKRDIEISALGYYPNYLDPDKEQGKEAKRYFTKVLELANRMSVGVVSTFAGRHPQRSVADNIPLFKEVFTGFCEEAESKNVRIAIENCPMMDRITMLGTNIAFSPEIWDVMFEEVPSECLGLELDPSHLVWLGIDYIQAVRDYGNRIFHIHAKDMEIDRKVLSKVGIYGELFRDVKGLGHGWWRARTPGWGEINWPGFISALVEVDYQGNIDIEHEDDVFAFSGYIDRGPGSIGSRDIDLPSDPEAAIVAKYGREEKGLLLGYNTLSKLIA